jgi:hypothetical protein
MASVGYIGDPDNPTPQLKIDIPLKTGVTTYHASPSETLKCVGIYDLYPHQYKQCVFMMHPAAPLLRVDTVIINPDYWENVQILPSKTSLEFDFKLDCYVGQGCVANLTPQNIKGTVLGSWEIYEGFTAYQITVQNKPRLLKLMMQNPPGRRILMDRTENNIQIPRITCYNLKLDNDYIMDDNDNESSEILGGDKVSYTGTAEITPNIIDAGLEVPTQIYSSAQEALNLNLFQPEIRPYIKKIFIDKYPNVVSLHSLDAGDVSRTLWVYFFEINPR